jgi:hypothetical protein
MGTYEEETEVSRDEPEGTVDGMLNAIERGACVKYKKGNIIRHHFREYWGK